MSRPRVEQRREVRRPGGALSLGGPSTAEALQRVVDLGLPTTESHHPLLEAVRADPLVPADARGVDLLVIPTSRPDPAGQPGFETALTLAQDGVVDRILILCSKDAARDDSVEALGRHLAARLARAPHDVAVAIEVVDGTCPRVPVFAADRTTLTSAWRRYGRGAQKCIPKANEVGAKRNLGLLLARRIGARHVLFLDDDVSPDLALARQHDGVEQVPPQTLDAATLVAAVAAVESGGLDAVGWLLKGYDDNSVVCRARTLVGDRQTQFVGGGVLLVSADRRLPFFPAVYNEDWLFLIGLAGTDGSLPRFGCGGVVRQKPYDGWLPRRARSEELGEMLGEGFLALVQAGLHPWQMHDREAWRRYWRDVMRRRRELVVDVRLRLGEPTCKGADDGEEAARASTALAAALAVHDKLEARSRAWVEEFVRYREAWLSDLETWNGCLAGPHPETTEDLLRRPVLIGDRAAHRFGWAPRADPDRASGQPWPGPGGPGSPRGATKIIEPGRQAGRPRAVAVS